MRILYKCSRHDTWLRNEVKLTKANDLLSNNMVFSLRNEAKRFEVENHKMDWMNLDVCCEFCCTLALLVTYLPLSEELSCCV